MAKITKTVQVPDRTNSPTAEEVAELFLKAEANGESGAQVIAERYSKAPRTVARWISIAREQGLIPESEHSTRMKGIMGAKAAKAVKAKATTVTKPAKPIKAKGATVAGPEKRYVPEEFEVRWEDPPSIDRSKNDPLSWYEKNESLSWYERLEPLKREPKRWAIVRTFKEKGRNTTAANNLRYGLLRIPAGKWEFTARSVGSEHHVYAKYLGRETKPKATVKR